MKRLILLGAGGFGRTVADAAAQTGVYESIHFLDDNAQGPAILGPCNTFANFADENTEFYPAFGNNEGRLNWIERLQAAGCHVASVIHPKAYVSPTARLGAGTVILPMATVNTCCRLEAGCIINCGAVVDHDCVLEAGVHICLGAIVKAENRIGRCMKIEAGQIIMNRTYPLGT